MTTPKPARPVTPKAAAWIRHMEQERAAREAKKRKVRK